MGHSHKESKILTSISEIKEFFRANETPVYFISATNFNLLGIDGLIGNLKCMP